jgi:chromate reductase, NAD(P)H dehydrogenase (quinone)
MIGILAGSSRINANTAKVGKAIKRIAIANGVNESQILMPDFTKFDIPFANVKDVGKDSLSDFQLEIYNAMSKSDLIFILTPEYNWFPSAEIINLINQFGSKQFTDCWDGKLFATCGISSGRGGRIPAVQLTYVINKLINVMDLHSIVSPKVFESQFTPKVLDADGQSLGNAEYDAGIEKFVTYNLGLLKKIKPGLSG